MSQQFLEYDPTTAGATGDGEDRLPFDPTTLLRSIWKWRWWMVLWVLGCLMLGIFCSWMFAPRVWVAETTVMYQPPAEGLLGGRYEPPTITTQLNMVKVKDNLSETRLRLALPSSLDGLGAAVDVQNPRDSELLHFKVSWSDPDKAEAIARTLRDVFIDQQLRIRRKELATIVTDLQQRLDAVRKKVRSAGDPTEAAKLEERRSKQRAMLQNRLETAGGNYDVTLGEIRSAESQLAVIRQKIQAERKRIEDDAAAGAGDDLSNINIRLGRLNEMITSRRREKVDETQRHVWLQKQEWNDKALASGLISKAQYDADVKAYEAWKAQVEDDDVILALKKEREQLFKLMTTKGPDAAATSTEMKSLQSNRLQLEVRLAGLREKAKDQAKRRSDLEKQLFAFLDGGQPAIKTVDPKLLLEWRKEEDELLDALDGLRSIFEKKTPDFRIVSDVSTPTVPARSYRKLFVIAICLFGAVLGVGAIAGYEMLDTTVKSRGETQLRLNHHVLGLLPEIEHEGDERSKGWDKDLLDPIRSIARQVRTKMPGKGARLLVVSAGLNEGCTTVSSQIARCFGQQGENVLLIDGDVRQTKMHDSLRELIVSPEPRITGLGELLTGALTRFTDVIASTNLFGVQVIPRSAKPIVPELLSSRRMFDLMDEVAHQHDFVLIDGPPAASNADAEILASLVDGVVFVVQSRRFRAKDVKKVLERLVAAGTPVLGVVLNRVEPMFMDRDWD